MNGSRHRSSRSVSVFSTIAIFIAIVSPLFFYSWTYVTNLSPKPDLRFVADGGSLYNSSTDGYLHGQLSFVTQPRPELLALADPYDHVLNNAYSLREASLYRGGYYLYFGPAPVLSLYVPFYLLTGQHLGDNTAVLLLGIGSYLLTVLMLFAVSKNLRHPSILSVCVCITAIGFNSFFGHFLRETHIFEVAIIAAISFLLASLYMFSLSISRDCGALPLQLSSGIFLGLAVASRYSYAVCAALLLSGLILITAYRHIYRPPKQILDPRGAIAVIAPCTLVISALLLHNFVRFGSAWEFGQAYQLTNVTIKNLTLMSWTYLQHNFTYYFLSFIRPDTLFPFFHESANSPLTDLERPGQGYHAVWNSIGVFNSPFLFFIIALPIAWIISGRFRKTVLASSSTASAIAICGITASANILVLLLFCGIVIRYVQDFMLPLLLISCISFLCIETLCEPRTTKRYCLQSLAIVLVAYGTVLNFGISLEGNYEIFRVHSNPKLYVKLQSAFEFVPQTFFSENNYGPIDIRLRFSQRDGGKGDPLVLSGTQQQSDLLSVFYPAKNMGQFVLFHDLGDGQGVRSAVFAIDPGKEYLVTVEMGSLYPRNYSFLAARGFDPTAKNRLRVKIDGQTVFDQNQIFYEGLPGDILIGQNRPVPASFRPGVFSPHFFNPMAFNNTFSGNILAHVRRPFLISSHD